MADDVTDDPHRHRYELTDGETLGYVSYRIDGRVMDVLHTEVDPGHSGRGLAAVLVGRVLDDARSRGLEVLPALSLRAHVHRRSP